MLIIAGTDTAENHTDEILMYVELNEDRDTICIKPVTKRRLNFIVC